MNVEDKVVDTYVCVEYKVVDTYVHECGGQGGGYVRVGGG